MARQTVTAFFDDRENAHNAVLRLRQYAFPDEDVTISPEMAGIGFVEDMPAHVRDYWAALETSFGCTDSYSALAEGILRGLVLVTVHLDRTKVGDIVAILKRYDSTDLSQLESARRTEGWSHRPTTRNNAFALRGRGLPQSTDSASTTWDEAAKGVLHTASASAAYRASDAPTKPLPNALDVTNISPRVDVSTRAIDRVELRGKVRLHDSEKDTSAGAIGDNDAVVALAQSTPVAFQTSPAATELPDVRTHASNDRRVRNMEVVGSDGQHVGIIDHVEGTEISLNTVDAAAIGTCHVIPTMWVQFIDEKVTLKFTAADAMSRWTIIQPCPQGKR